MAILTVDRSHASRDDDTAKASVTASLPWETLHRAVDGRPSRETHSTTYSGAEPAAAGELADDNDVVEVAQGIYEDDFSTTTGGNPAFDFTNSGASGQPIIVRPVTGHTPHVARVNQAPAHNDNAPVVGSGGASWVQWYNLILDGEIDCQFEAGGNNLCDGLIIDKAGPYALPASGEADGLRGEGVSNITYRNCAVRNVARTGAHENSAGVRIRNCTDITIENNHFHNCDGAIFLKETPVRVTVRKNYCTGSRASAVVVSTANNTFGPIQDVLVYQNIAYDVTIGITYDPAHDLANCTGNKFYNNVSYIITATGGGAPGLYGKTAGGNLATAPLWRLFNNIFVIADGGVSLDYYQLEVLPANIDSDFNCFFRTSGPSRFNIAGAAETFATWSARTPTDQHDGSALHGSDPLFVGAITGSEPAAAVFKLNGATSPVRAGGANPGKADGSSGDANVNMGAYLSDDDVIGPAAASVAAVWLVPA